MSHHDLNNFQEEWLKEETQKIEDWKVRKIQKKYPGYSPREVDEFLDVILKNYDGLLQEYRVLWETNCALKEQNMKFFNEIQEYKHKTLTLTKYLELEKMKK
ncbi:DivIVA domain-containing protein [Ureaplasma ceti]|uniref:DivIVA domain-containing protein n=1 Tax=Ureaplasma ceti TaxID=3119530 RepID=A0ABP9UA01_9BACT